MKKAKIVALAVAVMVVIAGAYVILNSGSSAKTNPPPNNNGDGNDKHDNDTGNTTLDVHFPVNLSADQAKLRMDVSYPGMSVGGSYEYSWTQPYEFSISSSPLGGYQGSVLLKLFALKSGEIGAKCLIVHADNRTVNWTLDEQFGINHISGDLYTWTSNGSMVDEHKISVVFNRTGDFELIFQSFDLDTGKALSVPLHIGPLKVPVVGTLDVKTLGPGSYVSGENGAHFVLLLNITNGWNIRYDVSAANLLIDNGTANVTANLTATAFDGQSLAAGQSTQFLAYFDVTGDPKGFVLKYDDPTSGQVIVVPLS